MAIAAGQDEPRDSFGMLRRVRDRHRRTVEIAPKIEVIQLKLIGDSRQVQSLRLDRDFVDISL